jgi:hypothetical protein
MDNLAVTEDYSKRLLETYDEKTADAYVRGKFVNLASGTVYYGFNKERSVKAVLKPSPYHTKIVGMDFNVNPMAMCAGWRDGNQLHFTHEWEMPNADTDYACQVLKEALPEHRMVYPDPTGNARHTNAPAGVTDFTTIRKHRLVVEAPHEPWARRDSLNSVNKKLSDGTLSFDPKCKKLIKYMMELTHERWNQQQHMTHLTDAMRYPVTFLFPIRRAGLGVQQLIGA